MNCEVLRSYWLIWLDYLRGGETQLVNTNKLVRYYNGIVGGKTGTTDNAGYCLTVCADEQDTSKLLPIKVVRGSKAEIVPIIEQQGVECVIRKGSASKVEYEYTFVEQVEAPVEKGQFLGEYLVTLDGAAVFRSDIIANEDIPRMDFGRCLGLVLSEIISM